MIFKHLQPGDEAILERFLSQYAQSSMFLRSNLRASGLGFENKPYHADYYAISGDSGLIEGVLAHCWNGNLLCQIPQEASMEAFLTFFRKQLSRPIAGVLGPETQAAKLIKDLGLEGLSYATNRKEALYALDLEALRIPEKNASGFRILEAKQAPENLIRQWLRDFSQEALGSQEEESVDELNRVLEAGWVLYNADQPVSLVAFNARLPECVQIGPVWTPPENRNQGYARLLLARVLELARTEGIQKAILFTDNPPAVKAYAALGFEKIDDYRLALLREPVSFERAKA